MVLKGVNLVQNTKMISNGLEGVNWVNWVHNVKIRSYSLERSQLGTQ